MNLFFRHFIVILLLLLQGLSPLVHAHVQQDSGEYGLHIDGISVPTQNNLQFSALKSIGHSDVVIGMRSAILQKNFLETDLPVASVCECTQYILQSPFKAKQVQFSLLIFQNKPSINLSIIAPRAPPSISRL